MGGDRFYLPQLDGLRFFAFLLVFLHHIRPPSYAGSLPSAGHGLLKWLNTYGWCGVDLFLVLSAYLITTLLLIEQKRHGSISLRDFYVRRSLRIWPLYFLAILLGFLLFPLYRGTLGSAPHSKLVYEHLGSYSVFLGNYSAGLFGYANSKFLAHLWTISLEEQFYVLWPLILVFLSRERTLLYRVLLALLGLTVFLRFACVFAPVKHPFVWTNLLTRLDPLVLGSWLALHRFETDRSPSLHPRTGAKLLSGVVLVVIPSFYPPIQSHSVHMTWQFSSIALGLCLVLDAAVCSREGVFARALSLPPLVWLGKLCYGLYVFHMFGILVSRKLALGLELPSGGYAEYGFCLVVGFALTLGLAALSYQLFERKFLKLKERFSHVRSRPT